MSPTIKLNNCTSAEQSESRCFTDGCQGPTDCEAKFDLPRKQKGPGNPGRVGGVPTKVL